MPKQFERHKCGEYGDYVIMFRYGVWELIDMDRLGKFVPILYCPFCGEKLPT